MFLRLRIITIVCSLVIADFQNTSAAGKGHSVTKSTPTYVRSYQTSTGKIVRAHYRSAPDGNPFNNWTTNGNVNPITRKPGSINPYLALLRDPVADHQKRPHIVRLPAAANVEVGVNAAKPNVAAAIVPNPKLPDGRVIVAGNPPTSPEEQAAFLLECIRDLARNKKTESVERRAQELIERFPDTKAAKDARSFLTIPAN